MPTIGVNKARTRFVGRNDAKVLGGPTGAHPEQENLPDLQIARVFHTQNALRRVKQALAVPGFSPALGVRRRRLTIHAANGPVNTAYKPQTIRPGPVLRSPVPVRRPDPAPRLIRDFRTTAQSEPPSLRPSALG